MAIQGIITGFADPKDPQHNVIVVGRGDRYTLVKDGVETEAYWFDVEEAWTALRMEMGKAREHWVLVRQLETAMGKSRVVEISQHITYKSQEEHSS